MKTNKTLLVIATLGLVALATPSFAMNYGNNCPQSRAQATAQYTPWNGGGSNAMSVHSEALAANDAGQTAVSAQYTPWDGGGSNAMSQSVAGNAAAPQHPVELFSRAAWNGGGSNAMTGID